MTLADDMATDAAALTSTNEMGEAVVYTPRGGTARSINAVVDRQPPESFGPLDGALIPSMAVEVRNHATLGVSPASVDVGGDRLTVADRSGGTATARRILRVVTSDPGMVRLLVQ